ncbi:MAG: prepilin-type N-terminal cleavage/methylation domain-containing protein [Gemmatimonadaceae bacterium]
MPHPTPSGNPRRGVTLIELLTALVLLGLLFLGMRALLVQLGDGDDRIARAARSADARGNGARTLRTLLRRAIAESDSTRQFAGDDSIAIFDCGCDVPAAWVEDCRVALAIVPRVDSSAVVAYRLATPPETLAVTAAPAAFRYLDRAGSDYVWLGGWRARITLPAALALVTPLDTVMFQVGGR